MTAFEVREQLSAFYGKTVRRNEDLAFDACCVSDYDPALLAAHVQVSTARFHLGPFDRGPASSPTTDDLPSATGCR